MLAHELDGLLDNATGLHGTYRAAVLTTEAGRGVPLVQLHEPLVPQHNGFDLAQVLSRSHLILPARQRYHDQSPNHSTSLTPLSGHGVILAINTE